MADIDPESMKVDELKAELKERGLPTSGRKVRTLSDFVNLAAALHPCSLLSLFHNAITDFLQMGQFLPPLLFSTNCNPLTPKADLVKRLQKALDADDDDDDGGVVVEENKKRKAAPKRGKAKEESVSEDEEEEDDSESESEDEAPAAKKAKTGTRTLSSPNSFY
jgi:hypothetical protein